MCSYSPKMSNLLGEKSERSVTGLTHLTVCIYQKLYIQVLPCGHQFCEQCVAATTTGSGASTNRDRYSEKHLYDTGYLCPDVHCSESRCMELIVDEMAGEHRRYSYIIYTSYNLRRRTEVDYSWWWQWSQC